MSLLESLGADASVLAHFETYAARGLVLARVAVSQRGHYQLIAEDGELAAGASGALWYRASESAGMPVTGDWAAARVVGPREAIVEAVLPRKTLFSRRAAGRREEEQPLAANIDVVFAVCALDRDFNLRRLERYLTLASEAGAETVVVLHKADLCHDIAARVAETRAIAGGAAVVPASTRTPGALEGVRAFLGYGRTAAFLGSSGAGKSSIVNCLLGAERVRTGEVRESDGRGRQTTTRRELLPLPEGGAVIDTPGIRELQLWAGQESLERTFDEIAAIARTCRFRDCSHSGEIGCAVAQAIAGGTLSPERLASYRKLTAEVERHREMNDPLAAAERKRKVKALHRRIREVGRRKHS